MTQADFLNADPPEPRAMPEVAMGTPQRFFNRELSWLAFNTRVLEEAENPRVPLLERVRFLSISATNLDEFYTVRVAGLRGLAQAGSTTPAEDGLSPSEQLVLIDRDARALIERQQRGWSAVRAELAAQGIVIVEAEDGSTRPTASTWPSTSCARCSRCSRRSRSTPRTPSPSSPTTASRWRSSWSARTGTGAGRGSGRSCRSRRRSTASSPCPRPRAGTACCRSRRCC